MNKNYLMIRGALATLAAALMLGPGQPAAQAAFSPFENFNALTLGPLNGQNGWVGNATAVAVATDPVDPANQVLSIAAHTSADAFKLLGNLALSNGTTGTLFYRFRRADTQLNISHGLSDLSTLTSPRNFADFEAQLQSNGTNPPSLNVRDAATARGVATFAPGVWYSVWLVIDNARDLYRVYLQGGSYSTPTPLGSGSEYFFTFRNTSGDGVNTNTAPVANDLVSFLVRSSGNQNHVGPFYLDDIFIDLAGANLSNPAADTNAPVVTSLSPAPDAIVQFWNPITVTFNELVGNVTAPALRVNDTPATQVTGAGTTWTFTFPLPAPGTVRLAWATNQTITDLSGNRFAGTNAWTFTLLPPDTLPPVVASVEPTPASLLTNWPAITLAFNEAVTGVDAADLLVNGLPATALTHWDDRYVFTAPQPSTGAVVFAFAPGHGIADLSGNTLDQEAGPNRWTNIFLDREAPFLTSQNPAAGARLTRLDTLEITFNETVVGLDAADLLINGRAATQADGSGAGPYRFHFPQPPLGRVELRWADPHGITDQSGNPWTGGAWTNTLLFPQPGFVLFDRFDQLTNGPINGRNGWITANPAFAVGPDPTEPANAVLVAPAMSESPLHKPLGALTFSNQASGTLFFRMRRADAALNISAGLSDLGTPTAAFADYEAQLNCNTTGANNLSARDAGAFDAIDSFTNDAWYSVWMVVDNARDLVSVFMQGGTLTNQTLLTGNSDGETAFTFRNSAGDAFNTNSGPVANDLVSFLVRIGGSHTGPFYLDDLYLDNSGPNLANPLGPDLIPPRLVAVDPPFDATAYELNAVTVTFHEPVFGVAAGDLLLNGSPATNLVGSWTTWTFAFPTPATGQVAVTWAPAHHVTDAAGNRFDATGLTWTYANLPRDTNSPLLSAVWPLPGTTLSNWSQVVVTFNEPVAGVDPFDLLLNGTPATALTHLGDSYFFTFRTPLPGSLTVRFDPASGLVDAFGNPFAPDLPAHSWSYTFLDTTPPLLARLSPPAGATVTRLDTLEVLFSEPVTGVDARHLLVNGTPATNLTGVGAGPYRFSFAPVGNGTAAFSWASGHTIADQAAVPNLFPGGAWSNWVVPSAELGTVLINEFLACNVRGLTNEFGDTADWIELHNPGLTPVNLLGWSLTDDPREPARWTFPAVTLQPGEFLVVWADGRDLRESSGASRLHANFQLNDQGGYLGLFNADFPPAAPVMEWAPRYPEQRPDYSFGLTASNLWRYLAAPTPGGPNGESSLTGLTPLPHVNASRGVYDLPFTLIATCPLEGATLRYTTDGSLPTELNGTPYTGPLGISNTTIFRLVAFASNQLPSRVSTHSYLFTDRVLIQPNEPAGYPVGTNVWTGYPSDYEMDPEIVGPNPAWVKESLRALPTLSVALNVDDLFGATNGLYTHPEATPREAWERACSAEFILTNGQTAFQVDCGLRVQGNASRTPQKTPKHPFRLFFRGAYGPGRLDYALFPDSPVTSFNTLVLRADFNGSWLHWNNTQRDKAGKVRDAWTKETFRAMTGTASHSRPFHLYLNGLYWGVYDFGERIDAEFAASYFGGAADEWDAIASKPTEAIDGNLTAYNAMVNLGRKADMTQPTNYLALQQRLDLPVFLDYMILNFYGANTDWGYDGNWNALCRRAPGEKFKYTAWDGELMLFFTNDNRVSADLGGLGLGGNQGLPSGLHTNLIRSAQYRLDFADRVQRHCFDEGALTPASASERWMQRAREVAPAMLAESARWGDYRRDVHPYSTPPYDLYTTNAFWWPEIERMRTTYFPVRTDLFLDQLRAAGLYPLTTSPVFSQHGGRVAPGYALTLSAIHPIYYTLDGTDPRVPFTGAIAPGALRASGPIPIRTSLTLKARALDGANWSALNEARFTVATLAVPLRVTELMPNPPGGEAYEFIELHHEGPAPLAVGGWSLVGLNYTFPAGAVLAPGQIIVLANNANPTAFAARYPSVTVYGWFGGRLDNGGERLALLDQTGALVLSVDYRDSGGWPHEADGGGYSLELVDPAGDPDAAANWRATTLLGTPGFLSPPPAPTAIRLSEIMADNPGAVPNADPLPDWIELENTSALEVNLDNWSLTDDSGARKFCFPSNTVLAAGGYLVVWCGTNSSLPGLHSGFSLDRTGETVSLFNASTTRVDALTYGLQLPHYSVGRLAADWVLTLPTPGAANVAAPTAPPTQLRINEWLANAPPGGADWIELFNTAAEPVALRGLALARGNRLFELRSLSFLGGLSHLQLLADEQPGVRHLDFTLPAEGGFIALLDPAAIELDRITYGPQVEGVSQGRLPSGGTALASFPLSPSPGASNYLVDYVGPVLNEILALNGATVTNAAGHTADWVELFNPLATVFDLSGFGLSTAWDNPAQWTFPTGVMIPANGFLVVWFDPDRPASVTNEPELNTGRALDGDSDAVYLFSAGRLRVDSVEFGPQARDWSVGRAGGSWTLLAAPTPGAANAAPAVLGDPVDLRLNEWLADPAVPQRSFLELHNLSRQPIQLGNLYLTDELSVSGQAKFQIAPLSFVAPLGFTAFRADGDPSQGRNHLNFHLDPDAESLRLSGPDLSVLDTVFFGRQGHGVSEGRLPDGAPSVASFACPTPGLGNSLSSTILVSAQPQSVQAQSGSEVLLQVRAQGGGELGYQWLLNGQPLVGSNSPALLLRNLQAGATGDYSVVVTNACARTLSEVARVALGPLPPATIAFEGHWPLITFTGTPLATFIVQRTEALRPPAWTNLATLACDAQGRFRFVDTNAPPTNAFYRVLLP